MNGFLLLLRHSMDDIPVGLFKTYAQALTESAKRKWLLSAAEERLFVINPTTPMSIAIVEFRSGKAQKMTIVRDCDDNS